MKFLLGPISVFIVFCSFVVVLNHAFGKNRKFDYRLYDSIYAKNAALNNDTFKENYFLLNDDTFAAAASYISKVFKKKASFLNTTFKKGAYFPGTEFQGNVEFIFNNFKGEANFTGVKFEKGVQFFKSIFQKKVTFTAARFDSTFSVYYSVFLDSIDFSDVTSIATRIDLMHCLTDTIRGLHEPSRRWIKLSGTDLSKIKMDYLHFRLYFDPGISYEEKANTYYSLLKNFRDDGLLDSYEILDKEFKALTYDHRLANSSLFGYPFILAIKFADRYWWDYGYEKGLVFKWIIIFLLCFTVITFLIYPKLRDVYLLDNIPCEWEIEIPYKQHHFFKKIYSAFIYTTLIFFSLNVKVDKVMWWRPKKYVAYIFIVYTVGIICLGYAINFVLQK